jgi:glutamyl/glutaminyl-tRNA synthetase
MVISFGNLTVSGDRKLTVYSQGTQTSGADLLTSTARQILVHRALGSQPPACFHCPLALDENGRRLAKRTAGLSIRELREAGKSPADVLALAASAAARSRLA